MGERRDGSAAGRQGRPGRRRIGDEAGAAAVPAKAARAVGAVEILVHCVGAHESRPSQSRLADACAKVPTLTSLSMA